MSNTFEIRKSKRYSNKISIYTSNRVIELYCNSSDNTQIDHLKIWYKIKKKLFGIGFYIVMDIEYYAVQKYIGRTYHESIEINKYNLYKSKSLAIKDADNIMRMIHDAIENKQDEDH